MDERLTTTRVLKAWWAMQWRAVVATFVGSLVLIAVFSFFAALAGMSKQSIMMFGNIIYSGVAIFASFYFFGFALKKDYGDFRFEILLKPAETEKTVSDVSAENADPEAGSENRDSVTDLKNISKE